MRSNLHISIRIQVDTTLGRSTTSNMNIDQMKDTFVQSDEARARFVRTPGAINRILLHHLSHPRQTVTTLSALLGKGDMRDVTASVCIVPGVTELLVSRLKYLGAPYAPCAHGDVAPLSEEDKERECIVRMLAVMQPIVKCVCIGTIMLDLVHPLTPDPIFVSAVDALVPIVDTLNAVEALTRLSASVRSTRSNVDALASALRLVDAIVAFRCGRDSSSWIVEQEVRLAVGTIEYTLQHDGADDDGVAYTAMLTIGTLCSGSDNVTDMVLPLLHDVLDVLTDCKEHMSPAARKKAMWALTNVACGTSAQKMRLVDLNACSSVAKHGMFVSYKETCIFFANLVHEMVNHGDDQEARIIDAIVGCNILSHLQRRMSLLDYDDKGRVVSVISATVASAYRGTGIDRRLRTLKHLRKVRARTFLRAMWKDYKCEEARRTINMFII